MDRCNGIRLSPKPLSAMAETPYIPWPVKYRPRTLDDVVGQDTTVTILRGMLKKQHISPSIILEGCFGGGKTTLARIVAKALLCTNPKEDGSACFECDSCVQMDRGQNVNYIEKDAASSGKVADIRELVKLCAYDPLGSRRRVILLDEAHKITSDGWNALLKTLEEGTRTTNFMFCTTEADKILEPVLSRSRRFHLNPILPEVVKLRMKHVLATEAITEFEEEALDAIALKAAGHMRDAINIMEQSHLLGGVNLKNVQFVTHVEDFEFLRPAITQLVTSPELVMEQIPVWLEKYDPQEIAKAVQEALTNHQLALWKVRPPTHIIEGVGETMSLAQWLSVQRLPSNLTTLYNFFIQLAGLLRTPPPSGVSQPNAAPARQAAPSTAGRTIPTRTPPPARTSPVMPSRPGGAGGRILPPPRSGSSSVSVSVPETLTPPAPMALPPPPAPLPPPPESSVAAQATPFVLPPPPTPVLGLSLLGANLKSVE